MFKAKFLVQTRYKGIPRKVGSDITFGDNDKKEAIRLADAGIIKLESDDVGFDDEHEYEDSDGTSYESMKAKDLYALCIEKGLEVEPKQSKEAYINALKSISE